jgi:hypothetical protein
MVRRGRAAWHFDKNGKISCVLDRRAKIDIDTREDWEKLNGGSASPETMSKGRRGLKVNYADGKR